MHLDRRWIASRIPHQHRMCLLEQVVEWDASRITCRATSHRDPDHPLRAHGRLGVACGIEYAAQAMAVHGALLTAAGGATRIGYLTSVRDVCLHASRLDDLDEDLQIEATQMLGDGNNVLYRFTVCAGGRELLTGRAAVVLDANLRQQRETGGR